MFSFSIALKLLRSFVPFARCRAIHPRAIWRNAKRCDMPGTLASTHNAWPMKCCIMSLTQTRGPPMTTHQRSRASAVTATMHVITGSSHTQSLRFSTATRTYSVATLPTFIWAQWPIGPDVEKIKVHRLNNHITVYQLPQWARLRLSRLDIHAL